MKKLKGVKDWFRGKFIITGDNVPNDSILGRIQIKSRTGSIICIKTREQAEWMLQSLSEAIKHTWGK